MSAKDRSSGRRAKRGGARPTTHTSDRNVAAALLMAGWRLLRVVEHRDQPGRFLAFFPLEAQEVMETFYQYRDEVDAANAAAAASAERRFTPDIDEQMFTQHDEQDEA